MRHFNRLQRTFRRCVALSFVIGLVACGKVYVEEELPNTFELSQDTPIDVELIDPANADDLTEGQVFDAVLAKPLYYHREKLDAEGNIFETTTLIAPAGAPVAGLAVDSPSGEDDAVGLRLTSITVHGGMSFPVETTVVGARGEEASTQPNETLSFRLTAPVDIALVLDYRDNEESGASAN